MVATAGQNRPMQFEKAWLAAQQRQVTWQSPLWNPESAGKVNSRTTNALVSLYCVAPEQADGYGEWP